MELSRRNFLKGIGLGGGVIATSLQTGIARAETNSNKDIRSNKAMLYDSSRCVGCRACQTACHRWNGLPGVSSGYGYIYDNPKALSAQTWTLIKARGSEFNGSKDLILCKYQCMHCTDAACVKVCPNKALTHHSLGFVLYDSGKCTGCGYCGQFCPFNVPKLGGNTVTGIQKIGKCTFCQDRVPDGREPACVEACPAGAILFGNRSDLVAEGKNRVNQIKNRYRNASIYGESELGGLHVLYVLKDSPHVYGFPSNPEAPILSWFRQDVIKPLGFISAGLVAAGLGLNYLVARANIKADKENDEKMEGK